MTKTQTAPAQPVGSTLPAPADQRAFAAPPRIVNDLARDLAGAAAAARAMQPGAGDVTVSAYTAVVCTGATVRDALLEAARWCHEAPAAEVHASSLARVPGHREDLWEYTVTLTVSFPDETGVPTGQSHHSSRLRPA
ncbi:hypothetical protein [Streptomyces tateyamensis]|uniref:hypothetical protein n=1 Tax=Streptomyces tateyamensis TaxID=565073 RepID=UPI0011B5F45D|nr:hypothetical protein [Streptomyces tateyamensis]